VGAVVIVRELADRGRAEVTTEMVAAQWSEPEIERGLGPLCLEAWRSRHHIRYEIASVGT
jgi:hypothetical protein